MTEELLGTGIQAIPFVVEVILQGLREFLEAKSLIGAILRSRVSFLVLGPHPVKVESLEVLWECFIDITAVFLGTNGAVPFSGEEVEVVLGPRRCVRC